MQRYYFMLLTDSGTSWCILIDLTFSFNNPPNIIITVSEINFDVVMNEYNEVVGRVYVEDAVVLSGNKAFHRRDASRWEEYKR